MPRQFFEHPRFFQLFDKLGLGGVDCAGYGYPWKMAASKVCKFNGIVKGSVQSALYGLNGHSLGSFVRSE
jgi:hypothetical protein